GIACLALALSIRSALREPTEAKAAGSAACVDQQARDETARLRRLVAERDALVTQLARAAGPRAGAPAATAPSAPPSTPADPRPRRYAHFEVPNPAVTVAQKDDGTYDIRTTDPKLAGTSLRITAVTESGEEDTLIVRIPPLGGAHH